MERQNLALHVVLALLFAANGAAVADEGGFLGKNTVEARRILRDRVEKREDSVIWARQLSALVFLERLSGNEDDAVKVWSKCDQKCRRLLPQDERQALELWKK